jgi:predicted component of type VI protein secretion system
MNASLPFEHILQNEDLAMIYKLVLQNEVDGLGRHMWTFKPPAILGRDPESDLCIDHASISRQHCQFSLNGDEALMIKDVGSTNGIYVDDNRIHHQVLMPDQIVQIGALQLKVQFSSENEHQANSRVPKSGNVDRTQPMPVLHFDPVAPERPWWRRIFR